MAEQPVTVTRHSPYGLVLADVEAWCADMRAAGADERAEVTADARGGSGVLLGLVGWPRTGKPEPG